MTVRAVTSESPVTFERRGGGRLVAKLGRHDVGEISPWEVSASIRAAWRVLLPGVAVCAPQPAASMEAAQRALAEHVWDWLEGAGVVLTRSHDARRDAGAGTIAGRA